jgi:uncharacterized protein (DUF1800 family)
VAGNRDARTTSLHSGHTAGTVALVGFRTSPLLENSDMVRTATDTTLAAALAAHRFGLGEPNLEGPRGDAAGWLLAQIGPADPQRGENLATLGEGVRSYARFLQAQRRVASPAAIPAEAGGEPAMAGTMATDMRSGEQQFADHFRSLVQADVRAHLGTAAASARPFAERLAMFWANHFTVSIAKASTRGLAGAFEREAIRPNIAGSFENLLLRAVTHGSMLRYLDNELSAGPHSRLVQRRARRGGPADMGGGLNVPRISGLNENLAREVLELHTLGAASHAYTQADVTAFASVLTGWRVGAGPLVRAGLGREAAAHFDPDWHEPGPKTVLGRTYPEGPEGLAAVLRDLARHPATPRFVSTKLARHFVADEPPAALVEQLVAAWQRSDGDLPTVYRALVTAPQAWAAQAAKLKTPVEFAVSTARVLGLGAQAFTRLPDGGIGTMGQRPLAAPSPAGWPDRAEEWLGPDAVWKRVEWATRLADRVGRGTDARTVAREALGPLLQPHTAREIERAADGPQALALLLLAPEFQRR